MCSKKNRYHGSSGAPVSQKEQVTEVHPSQTFPAPNPCRYENSMIDSYIRSQSMMKIFACNGWQEHGKIRAHDDRIIVVVHDPIDGICIMYKHALSTVEVEHGRRPTAINDDNFDFSSLLPDPYQPSLISQNLEEEWLDKFTQKKSNVDIVTLKGYQEHGFILAHDSTSIVFIRYKGDSPKLIYKTAISTIYFNYWAQTFLREFRSS